MLTFSLSIITIQKRARPADSFGFTSSFFRICLLLPDTCISARKRSYMIRTFFSAPVLQNWVHSHTFTA